MNLTIPEVILKVQDIDQRLIELGNELEEQDIIMNDPNSTEDVIEEATEKFMKIIGEGGALTVERMDLQSYAATKFKELNFPMPPHLTGE